jgi:hypothetical protein
MASKSGFMGNFSGIKIGDDETVPHNMLSGIIIIIIINIVLLLQTKTTSF